MGALSAMVYAEPFAKIAAGGFLPNAAVHVPRGGLEEAKEVKRMNDQNPNNIISELQAKTYYGVTFSVDKGKTISKDDCDYLLKAWRAAASPLIDLGQLTLTVTTPAANSVTLMARWEGRVTVTGKELLAGEKVWKAKASERSGDCLCQKAGNIGRALMRLVDYCGKNPATYTTDSRYAPNGHLIYEECNGERVYLHIPYIEPLAEDEKYTMEQETRRAEAEAEKANDYKLAAETTKEIEQMAADEAKAERRHKLLQTAIPATVVALLLVAVVAVARKR